MSTLPTNTNTFLIPLAPDFQVFDISLGGNNYQITLKWNESDDGGWMMDLADTTGNSIVSNIPLVTGEDLLSGLEYLGIPGSFYVLTEGSSPLDNPTLANLGQGSDLFFVSAVV